MIVITGSLIGMNWLTGRHELEGIIDGLARWPSSSLLPEATPLRSLEHWPRQCEPAAPARQPIISSVCTLKLGEPGRTKAGRECHVGGVATVAPSGCGRSAGVLWRASNVYQRPLR